MRTLLGMTLVLALTAPAFAAEKGIVDTAVAAGQFKTLAAALQAAGLVDTLKREGPFTDWPRPMRRSPGCRPGRFEDLLKPEGKAKLTAILTYHVLPGKAMAADVIQLNGKSVKTVQGSPAQITVDGGAVRINDVRVITTDIGCTNGVIHVIDTVLLPPTTS